jgi:hypothetical protein
MLKHIQGKTSATAPAQETVIENDPLPSAGRLSRFEEQRSSLQKKTARSLA